jgi:hypothetical protein
MPEHGFPSAYIVIFFVFNDLRWQVVSCKRRGRRGRDRMVVGFTTIYAISAYHF